MFKGGARVTFYILICIPVCVIAFLLAKQIQSAFELRKSIIDGKSTTLSLIDLQQIMATSELSTRSFFMIFICFLMILCGLLIVLKGTGNALSFTKEQKVKYSLKTAFPGLIMSIGGCILLAFSIYKSAQINLRTTSEFIHFNEKATLSVLPSLVLIEDSASKPANISTPGVKSIEENNSASLTKTEIKMVQQIKPNVRLVGTEVRSVTEEEGKWASALAVRAITNKYTATSKDRSKFKELARKSESSATDFIDPDLDWAFNLLLRTEQGYQPIPPELDRYEAVVRRYLSVRSTAPTASRLDL